MHLFRTLTLWASLLFSLFPSFTAAEKFIISSTNDVNIPQTFAPPVIEAYKAIGIEAEVIYMPNGRAWQSANEGLFDAELIRVSKVGDQAKHLVKVPVPLGKVQIKLYCGPNALVCNLSVLDDPNQTIATIEGFNSFKQLLANRAINQYPVASAEQIYELVLRGRIDYTLVLLHEFGTTFPKTEGLKASTGVLAEDSGYHYIHTKHVTLLPKLTRALSKTVEESEFLNSRSK